MFGCKHEIVEWQHRCQGMHVVGWMCRWCSSGRASDYHHETQCHRDYCGADPISGEAPHRQLSPDEFRIELERIVYRALLRSSDDPPQSDP